MINPSNNYMDKDFDSLRERLISLIRSAFPTWTDFQVADFGNILLEGFAFVGDVLLFNLDSASREAKWGTANQRRSLLRLAKQIAYKPKGASAASTTETLSATSLLANVPIPAGTVIKTKTTPPVEFQTQTEVILTPSSPSAQVEIENSVMHSETFEAGSEANQTHTLGQIPYLDYSAEISTTQGVWTEVPNFLSSRATDRHYTLQLDANDQATITFGDGFAGVLPIGTVTISYKTGGGAVGTSLDPGSLTEIQGSFFDALGNQVTVSAVNYSATVGGMEKETIATLKVRAPLSIRAGDRTVSRGDFETRARQAAGVGRVLMLTRNEDPAVELNTGKLWVVPEGLGFLTPTIRSAISTQFALYPYAPTFALDLMDAWYLDVYFSTKIYLQGSAKPAVVKAAVLANLQAYFALTTKDALGNTIDNPTVDFGWNQKDGDGVPVGSLALPDLFNVVRDTVGIRRVGGNPEDFQLRSVRATVSGDTEIQGYGHHDLTILNREFPRFGGITLVDGDTGLGI